MSIDSVTETMLRIAERFGVPVVLLAIFIWFAREATIAVHNTIVEPVVKSHTQFVDTICEQVKTQTDAMEEQAKAFRELSKAHDEQVVILRRAFPDSTGGGERRREPAVPQ